MRFGSNRKILISTVLWFILFSSFLNGQTYRFRNYGNLSDIPNNFVYTLIQDNNGYLWVGNESGLSKFDGFRFHHVAFPDSVVGRYPTSCIKDKYGILWFGCNDGSVFLTEEQNLKQLPIKNTSSITSLIEKPDGSIWIVPQSGSLFSVNPADQSEIKELKLPEEIVILSASFSPSGNILLGLQEKIRIFSTEGDTLIAGRIIDGFEYSGVTAILNQKGSDKFLAGTNGNGIFRIDLSEEGNTPKRLSDNEELAYLDIQSIYEDSENNFWIGTNEAGIIRLQMSEADGTIESLRFFNKGSGLPGNNIKVIFEDFEGNYWIGLFGDGLSMLPSLAFAFYSPGSTPGTNNIIYVNQIAGDYFLGTPTGYYLFNLEENKVRSATDLHQSTGKNEIAAYCIDDNNNIWVGTLGGGLFKKSLTGPLRLFYRSGNSSEDNIKDIKVDRDHIWIGTLNGVVILDRGTGGFIKRYNINNGLPHNSIDQIFLTSDGKAAVATKTDRVYLIDSEKGVTSGNVIPTGSTMNIISAYCQSRDGNLWAATAGNGVYELRGDSVTSYTRADMMMSDYCYSILADSVNRIWIGHERGFSRYNRTTGLMRTFGTDFASGGMCNSAGMFESSDGKVLIGTTEGLIVYDRLVDQRTQTAPFNNINYIIINDIKYPYKPSFTLPYSKKYTIVVDFIGINFREPEKVYYQTKLDNWDDTWSDWKIEREVTTSPRDGRYKFNMISVNEDGLSRDPVSFDLIIKKPIWRTWWFILSSIAVLTGIVILIIREREKAQKKIELYLKTELDARTQEVVRQKGEIEIQNIEITDSINYAKRIQTSILPDLNKLKDTFRDAFIFFRPRDIVSGDFYWFDKFSDEKFMLVCADSTGHGVPGAFMSMIGSTLLMDIVSRQRISRPSQILKMLDTQIFSTLNQNLELGVSNDGMDMVICEINLNKRHLRFASAMRPVIIVIGGEPFYIKGNRSSIGGESVIEKFFDDQEYFMNEGDTMYLFSDGLPDQFGGQDGKKMKIARLKKLIEEVAGLPMSDQKGKITKYYDDWKGSYEQVDDVLMMGIRF